MRHVLLISGLTIALALPVSAEYRDSDGDVISVFPYSYDRDSDGNVKSVLYRDSDGNVIAVLSLVDDLFAYQGQEPVEVTPEVLDAITPAGRGAVPQQVTVNGISYAVRTVDDRVFLTRLQDGVNPVAYTLE